MTPLDISVDELDFGDTIPGVTCPDDGAELVYTSSGGFCDWCEKFVPIVGAVLIVTDEPDGPDWTDDEEDVTDAT